MTSGTGFGNVKRWLIFFRKRESGAIVGGGAAPRGGVLDEEKPRHDRTGAVHPFPSSTEQDLPVELLLESTFQIE